MSCTSRRGGLGAVFADAKTASVRGCAGCTGGNCATCKHGGPRHQGSRRVKKAVPEPPRNYDLAYIFDGSLEGMLCAVFDAYARRENPADIFPAQNAQLGLMQEVHEVVTDEAHALRVRNGIIRQLGGVTFDDVKRVFLSDDPDRCTAIYRFLRMGFSKGVSVRDDLSAEDVARFAKLSNFVSNESEHTKQFIRFEEAEGGVYFARITPQANVIPLVMGFFAARLNTQAFVVYDEVHNLAGMYNGKRWVMQPVEEDSISFTRTRAEGEFADMWRVFYHSIGIEGRTNHNLRRNLMPKRFWKNMTEFQPGTRRAETVEVAASGEPIEVVLPG